MLLTDWFHCGKAALIIIVTILAVGGILAILNAPIDEDDE